MDTAMLLAHPKHVLQKIPLGLRFICKKSLHFPCTVGTMNEVIARIILALQSPTLPRAVKKDPALPHSSYFLQVQSTLVNSTMHNSILPLISTGPPGPGIFPYILLQFHNVYLDNG